MVDPVTGEPDSAAQATMTTMAGVGRPWMENTGREVRETGAPRRHRPCSGTDFRRGTPVAARAERRGEGEARGGGGGVPPESPLGATRGREPFSKGTLRDYCTLLYD